MRAHLRRADRIFVDETRVPVLDPGRKATKSGYFWAVVADDRGHGGTGPPIVLFHYAPGRGKEHPLKFLAGYQGQFLQNGRREPGGLLCRHAVRHPGWPPAKPHRRPDASVLQSAVKPRRIGERRSAY